MLHWRQRGAARGGIERGGTGWPWQQQQQQRVCRAASAHGNNIAVLA